MLRERANRLISPRFRDVCETPIGAESVRQHGDRLQKEAWFRMHEIAGLALTYDDVRLRTGPSEVAPHQVDITSKFSRNIELKVPIVSSPMDTVTESEMAIAMAKLGGLGVIHAALTQDQQRKEVRRVKLHLNGLIETPITVTPDRTLASVLEECENRGFDFRTFPVVDEENRLRGLITESDFSFSDDLGRDHVKDAMTPLHEVTTGKDGMSVEQAYALMKGDKRKMLPLVSENGRLQGMYILSDVLRIMRDNPSNYSLDKNGRLLVAAAVPTDPEEALSRVNAMKDYLDVVIVDTAQGDSQFAFQALKTLKENTKGIDIVMGNISEARSAARLADRGADGVRIGQGPGSICTTRVETGIGTPQITAIHKCLRVARRRGIPGCADGGLTNKGDISLAIAAWADSVMMGSMLSGTAESPGEIITLPDGSRGKIYRGMGSASALRDSASNRKRYSVGKTGPVLPEGIESVVPYKGSVYDLIPLYVQALKKSMSYVGAPTIKHHQRYTRFQRITGSGLRESHPHDVQVVSP